MNDLNAKGYDILDDSWEDSSGIVDIVVREGDVLVFAEVTTPREWHPPCPKSSSPRRTAVRFRWCRGSRRSR